MQDMQPKMNSWITLNKLKNATGEEFERYAQFFMLLIDSRYFVTRAKKDNGIDGYIYLNVNNNKNIQYFSIYGPEAKTSWTSRKKKLLKDLQAIIDDATRSNSKIAKWTIVSNFAFTKDQSEELSSICTGKSIAYELLHPKKIISKLESLEQIYKAAAFVDGIPFPERKLTENYFHTFARDALKLLVKFEDDGVSTTQREELLRSLRKDILLYIPKDVCLDLPASRIANYNKKEMKTVDLLNIIRTHTRLNPEFILIHQYSTKTESLHTYTLEEAEKLGIAVGKLRVKKAYKDLNGTYYLRIDDLSILAYLMQLLLMQNRSKGKYSVENALIELSLMHYRYLPENKLKVSLYPSNKISTFTATLGKNASENIKKD